MRPYALLAPAAAAALALLAACGEARPYADPPAETASAAACAGCHGDAATASRLSGAHAAHVSGGPALACAECHVVPAAVASPGHADGEADVVFGERAGGAAAQWDAIAGSCAVACHGSLPGGSATKPVWTGDAGSLACGSCHGVPPPAPHTVSTSCGSCHTGYTATAVNEAVHRNGTVDVAQAAACGSCHGIPPSTGEHRKHVVDKRIACGTCHAGASATNGGPAHLDGVTNVSAPGWNASQRSCANSCHGSEYW